LDYFVEAILYCSPLFSNVISYGAGIMLYSSVGCYLGGDWLLGLAQASLGVSLGQS